VDGSKRQRHDAIPALATPWVKHWYSEWVSSHTPNPKLRIAAIRFLNPAPLMWDFEHEPHKSELAGHYDLDYMMPAQCAERLALSADHPDAADIGLVPVAALATIPGIKIIPGCAIASKHKIRSLLLIRRADQPIADILTIAADTSSRATLAYTQILFQLWQNPFANFLQHRPDLDSMLAENDAAILIGDPALFAMDQANRRTLDLRSLGHPRKLPQSQPSHPGRNSRRLHSLPRPRSGQH
jgi:predicted solute-binding protein